MTTTALLADEYFSALERASRSDAVDVAVRARVSGVDVWEVAHRVIGRAQREVGDRWQRNEWTVADEHAASVISQIALSAITGGNRSDRPHGTVVGACVEGEWHAFPLRLVGEGLRAVGWEFIDLGASLPADQLAAFIAGHRPDVVVLSASMTGRLPAARSAASAVAAMGLPAVLGGAAVERNPEWAARVGAVAGTGEPLRLHDQLVDLRGAPPAAAKPVDGAFDAVVAAERQLSSTVLSAVSPSRPEILDGWEAVLDSSVPELVAALTAAVLVDEPALLRDQVRWLDDVLAARHAPDGTVDAALDALEQAVDRLVPVASYAVAGAR